MNNLLQEVQEIFNYSLDMQFLRLSQKCDIYCYLILGCGISRKQENERNQML